MIKERGLKKINVEKLFKIIGSDFYTGMTDSQLKLYAITVVFIVGWSSEPDIHDEP